MALFKATKIQVITYLLGVCPFSIAFLVFLNSSVSFVITDIINLHHGQGDAVGTLGFADELLALVACPAWGLLSDRIGVRYVCVLAYLIIALALVLFVQAKNVYPQLLLGRLLFSVGAAAASTMVTAILPAVVAAEPHADGRLSLGNTEVHPDPADLRLGAIDRFSRVHTDSISSDATITPARFQRESSNTRAEQIQSLKKPDLPKSSSSKVAGFVGLFTGAGALIAIAVFLPLPARFQNAGVSPSQALQDSYYIVAVIAFVLAVMVFFGFSGIAVESEKFLARLWGSKDYERKHDVSTNSDPFWARFVQAFVLGIRHSSIGLGYVGGFVARASSVGISLFIPLAINAQFRSAGLCQISSMDVPAGLPDIKRQCPRAYTLSAELTGVSQLIALLAAPLFGYLGSRLKRNIPLSIGALTGIVGYIMFGLRARQYRQGTNGTPSDFVAMALIGLSQISAIVCSLGVLSDGILQQSEPPATDEGSIEEGENDNAEDSEDEADVDESTSLVKEERSVGTNMRGMKGSIAGMYSLFGGAGILILTKVGGALFDSLSYGSPFFIMAIFNGILLVTCIFTALQTAMAHVLK